MLHLRCLFPFHSGMHKLHSEIIASINFTKNQNLVPWIREQPYIKMLLRQFSNINAYIRVVGKMPKQHVNARGGGQQALFDLSFRHDTTQTQAYFGVFVFFRKKFLENQTLRRSNHFLKIQWEIHFVTFFFKYQPKLFKKKFSIEILVFFFQICFWNQFLTSGSGQTENAQIRVFAYYKFDQFPKSKIDSEGRFEKRMPIFLF